MSFGFISQRPFSFFAASFRRLNKDSRAHLIFRLTVIALVTINEIWWFFFAHYHLGAPAKELLPLHLCNLSFFVLIGGLAAHKKLLCDFAYYIGVPGLALAIFFLNIQETPPYQFISSFRYFFSHATIIATGFYLTIGIRYRPKLSGV